MNIILLGNTDSLSFETFVLDEMGFSVLNIEG